jgi:SSS family solute:Na+ symporter
VILAISPQFSIDFQLIGGVIILQTLPAVAVGLYTRWLHRWGLVLGWIGGMALGLGMMYSIENKVINHKHFGGVSFPLSKWLDPKSIGLDPKTTVYVGFIAVLFNLLVAVVATFILRAAKAPDGVDATAPDDYTAEGPAEAPPELGAEYAEPAPTG